MAEGGGLLNRYTLQRRIEGSNPSVSASVRCPSSCNHRRSKVAASFPPELVVHSLCPLKRPNRDHGRRVAVFDAELLDRRAWTGGVARSDGSSAFGAAIQGMGSHCGGKGNGLNRKENLLTWVGDASTLKSVWCGAHK